MCRTMFSIRHAENEVVDGVAVSPVDATENVVEESEESGNESEEEGVEVEKVTAIRDERAVKKLMDPRLISLKAYPKWHGTSLRFVRVIF